MTVILRDVTVVSTHDGSLTRHQDVHIAGDTIARVTPTGDGPADTVVAGHGRYVVPGYLDMHTHPLGWGDQTSTLSLMLTNGITGFRQMGGSPEVLARRAEPLPIDALSIAGMPLISMINARDEDTVVRTIREQHAQGADFIKVADMIPPTFAAAQAEADRLGVPLLGHLPPGVDVREAATRGMRSIEHLGPGVGILAACSDDEEAVNPPLSARPVRQLDRDMVAQFQKMVINPVLRTSDAEIERLRLAIETFNENKARDLAGLLAANETWQCPTLVRVRAMELADDPAYRDEPEHRYMATTTLEAWQEVADEFARRSPEFRAVYRDVYQLQLRLVKIFDEMGVPMLAGSDSCGSGWEVPGLSLHQEFGELARAELSPLRILQMATVDGARYSGRSDRLGSVTPGKAADLVLLDADPTLDVRNLRAISGVIRAGHHHDKTDLDRTRHELASTRTIGR